MSNSPKYQPEFKGPIEGYVVNSLKTNRWRIEASMTHDDAMQEAFIVFLRVATKYPGVEAKHFMALYKRAWHNQLNDLATKDTELRALIPLTRLGKNEAGDSSAGERFDYEPVGETDNEGALGVLVRQAPREVQAVLNLFLSAPQEILDLALSGWTNRDRRTKTGGSERICKLLGLPKNLDVLAMVEEHFGN